MIPLAKSYSASNGPSRFSPIAPAIEAPPTRLMTMNSVPLNPTPAKVKLSALTASISRVAPPMTFTRIPNGAAVCFMP